jgi:hypothetical protein
MRTSISPQQNPIAPKVNIDCRDSHGMNAKVAAMSATMASFVLVENRNRRSEALSFMSRFYQTARTDPEKSQIQSLPLIWLDQSSWYSVWLGHGVFVQKVGQSR